MKYESDFFDAVTSINTIYNFQMVNYKFKLVRRII